MILTDYDDIAKLGLYIYVYICLMALVLFFSSISYTKAQFYDPSVTGCIKTDILTLQRHTDNILINLYTGVKCHETHIQPKNSFIVPNEDTCVIEGLNNTLIYRYTGAKCQGTHIQL